MRFGDLEVDLISDGLVRVDAGGPFGLVPRSLYERYVTLAEDNTLTMALTCMLVRSRGKTILIDTGLGNKLKKGAIRRWGLTRNAGGLLDNLAKKGVAAQDVDIVINTHLHSDHCGGNTVWEGEKLVATFPEAEYWVQRMEWADASHPDARTRSTYLTENFSILHEEGRLKLLHGDTSVTDQVRCVVTPGHTRGHQSVLLQDGSWHGLFLADLATFAIHFARAAWLTSYDVLPLENVRTKTHWQRWALEHDAWIFVEHDPAMPVAHLIEEDGRINVESLGLATPLIDDLPK
ncbi:MAG: MBL fold metallo-hydrolase [Anaerolineales bacterium]|nr:MBL fold metallo-hydrolase [Anaerolineales bacterium]